MGELIGDLGSRRGQVESTIQRGTSRVIKAHVPLVDMFGYATTIRSLSQGRAAYSMEPAFYQQVPSGLTAKIVGVRAGAKR